MLASSSCGPHCRPPIAHVPRPIVVISKSVLPKRRFSTRPSCTQQSVEKSILHVEPCDPGWRADDGYDRARVSSGKETIELTGPRTSVAEKRGAFVRMVHQSLRELVRQNGEKGAASQTNAASTGKMAVSRPQALICHPSIPDGS